eukprot:g20114.t1
MVLLFLLGPKNMSLLSDTAYCCSEAWRYYTVSPGYLIEDAAPPHKSATFTPNPQLYHLQSVFVSASDVFVKYLSFGAPGLQIREEDAATGVFLLDKNRLREGLQNTSLFPATSTTTTATSAGVQADRDVLGFLQKNYIALEYTVGGGGGKGGNGGNGKEGQRTVHLDQLIKLWRSFVRAATASSFSPSSARSNSPVLGCSVERVESSGAGGTGTGKENSKQSKNYLAHQLNLPKGRQQRQDEEQERIDELPPAFKFTLWVDPRFDGGSSEDSVDAAPGLGSQMTGCSSTTNTNGGCTGATSEEIDADTTRSLVSTSVPGDDDEIRGGDHCGGDGGEDLGLEELTSFLREFEIVPVLRESVEGGTRCGTLAPARTNMPLASTEMNRCWGTSDETRTSRPIDAVDDLAEDVARTGGDDCCSAVVRTPTFADTSRSCKPSGTTEQQFSEDARAVFLFVDPSVREYYLPTTASATPTSISINSNSKKSKIISNEPPAPDTRRTSSDEINLDYPTETALVAQRLREGVKLGETMVMEHRVFDFRDVKPLEFTKG